MNYGLRKSTVSPKPNPDRRYIEGEHPKGHWMYHPSFHYANRIVKDFSGNREYKVQKDGSLLRVK